jgi:hypothetical protein
VEVVVEVGGGVTVLDAIGEGVSTPESSEGRGVAVIWTGWQAVRINTAKQKTARVALYIFSFLHDVPIILDVVL